MLPIVKPGANSLRYNEKEVVHSALSLTGFSFRN